MHILIVSDAYPPMRTSCAAQIYELGQAFLRLGHRVSIIIPSYAQKLPVEITVGGGPTIYSVCCLKTKDVGYFRRTLAEFINPFIINFFLKKDQFFKRQKIDGVVWYSPTIFWTPLIKSLQSYCGCKSYLVLRDIFPKWAFDLGLIKSRLVFGMLQYIAGGQYMQADRIGVQSPNNLTLLKNCYPNISDKLEVLWNWSSEISIKQSPIRISETKLSSRKVFIYSGNMGVAQGMSQLLDLIKEMQDFRDLGFIFVGRGSEKAGMEEECKKIGVDNVLFYDEIDPEELNDLCGQCHGGLITLDYRHRTHNIPGKFLTYLQNGLVVFALINKGNDLIEIIDDYGLGASWFPGKAGKPAEIFHNLIFQIALNDSDGNISPQNCKEMAKNIFSSDNAAKRIQSFFESKNKITTTDFRAY